MKHYRILCLLLAAVFIADCGRFGSGNGKGMTASVFMDDTAASYNVWLTIRTPLRAKVDSLTIAMDIAAPDGLGCSLDTLVIPMDRDLIASGSLKGIRSCSSVLSYDVEVLYRAGVRPVWPGEWKLSFAAEPPVVGGIWARVEKME